jgi:hypothetical protein
MTRKALAVGVNQYQSVSELKGCVHDATNIQLVLERFHGFTSDDVRVLLDESATRHAIARQIGWLVEGARAGDLLVFHFSGHGSRVPDDDGEEIDRLDEILCPHDMAWDGTFITDDFLRDNLRVPAGVVLEVILDACHTGDANLELGFGAGAGNGSDPDRQPRFLTPPPNLRARVRSGAATRRLLRNDDPNVVLWSACAASQTAADARINDMFNGAFTFYLCKHIRESQGNLSRQALLERVRASLAEAGYSQVPELAATNALKAAKPFQL